MINILWGCGGVDNNNKAFNTKYIGVEARNEVQLEFTKILISKIKNQ
jgi:hypothetical protein